MTLIQFTKLRNDIDHKHLNNGEFLQSLIVYFLNEKMALTLLQDSTLSQTNGGDFKPSDERLYPSVLEVIQLVSEDNVDSLLTLLKRLPKASISTKEIFYIDYGNGKGWKKTTRTVFYGADMDRLSGRWVEGKPRPKRKRVGHKLNSEKLGEYLKERLEGWDEFFNREAEPEIKPLDIPVPVEFKPIGDEDEFGDYGVSEDESGFSEDDLIEPDEPVRAWRNTNDSK